MVKAARVVLAPTVSVAGPVPAMVWAGRETAAIARLTPERIVRFMGPRHFWFVGLLWDGRSSERFVATILRRTISRGRSDAKQRGGRADRRGDLRPPPARRRRERAAGQ